MRKSIPNFWLKSLLLTSLALPAHAAPGIPQVSAELIHPALLGKVWAQGPITTPINAWATQLLTTYKERTSKAAVAQKLIEMVGADPSDPLNAILGSALTHLLRQPQECHTLLVRHDDAPITQLAQALSADKGNFGREIRQQLQQIAGQYRHAQRLFDNDNLLTQNDRAMQLGGTRFSVPSLKINSIVVPPVGRGIDQAGNRYYAFPEGGIEFRVNQKGYYIGTVRSPLGSATIGPHYVQAWEPGTWAHIYNKPPRSPRPPRRGTHAWVEVSAPLVSPKPQGKFLISLLPHAPK